MTTTAVHPSELRKAGSIVLLGLLTVAAVDLAGNWLSQRPLAACAVQVAIAEYGAGRMAIAWSPPSAIEPTAAQIGKRIGKGALFGLCAAIALVLAGILSKTLEVRAGSFDIAPLLTGFAVAAFTAARDELLLRGIVIRTMQSFTRGWPVLVACAAAAIARGWFDESMTPQSALVTGIGAVALACIWLVDRGAWMAVGAHAAFLFASNVLLSTRGTDPPWGGGPLGMVGGRTSAIAMGLVGAAAVVWWRRNDVSSEETRGGKRE